MNPLMGWLLAAGLLTVATAGYGWQGALAALSAIVFWLLLQFNRGMRVMNRAAAKPVGQVGSAVMLNAKLQPGMTMLQVIQLTGSLGRKRDESGDRWEWADDGGSRVELDFSAGKLVRHRLDRPAEPPPPAA